MLVMILATLLGCEICSKVDANNLQRRRSRLLFSNAMCDT